MTKWEKLLSRVLALSNDLRFDEVRKILESYGYVMKTPRGGSSHFTGINDFCSRRGNCR